MIRGDRSSVLDSLATLIDSKSLEILDANERDMIQSECEDISLTDRLRVDAKKISEMVTSLRSTALKPNPDGLILYQYRNENDLLFENVTVPFGTILIIYESRPDVTVEAAAMAFKSGNRIMLKGGKEARNTNLFLIQLWQQALVENGFTGDEVTYLDFSRQEIQDFISADRTGIDLIIPRGGEKLIDFVVRHASAPVIISGRGNNFVYIHSTADQEMAINIIADGKHRISVCNATDKVLIDKKLLKDNVFLTNLTDRLKVMGIQILGDRDISMLNDNIDQVKGEEVLYEEFLAPKIMFLIVNNTDQAIQKINAFSGGHSASIICEDLESAKKFMTETDCAAVYHNASTRFTDGGQVGFGGEMAISTQKLHFRGPIGMDQLVTNKWMIYGKGHTRN